MSFISKPFLILCLMTGALAANAQVDSLIMKSGEILVGEIKGYDEGVVTIETSYSDSDFKVEGNKVVSINTEQKFVILSSNGDRYFGRLVSEKEDSLIVRIIDEDAEQPLVYIDDIVYFKEVEDTFLSRLDLSLSAGYTLTKANNSNQFSGNFKTGYLSSNFKYDLYAGMIRSVQTAEDVEARVSRTDGGFGVLYFIVGDWFGVLRSDLLQSSEQKLSIRAITKGGVGHYAFKTNKMNLGFAVGAAWNVENYDDISNSSRNSAEAFLAAEYKIFDMGDLDLLTKAIAYPSLTESKRFRTDFDFNLEYEFDFDLFINLGFTLNYDNQPVEGASSSDYVFQTTIGWDL